MSRLIVKNLPVSVTQEKLLSKFSTKGTVTDVQLKYDQDGKFRKFAFVGFKEEEEAKAALEFFDSTFIGSNRIKVEVCADLGSSSKPRAWSKYAKGSSAYLKFHPEEVEHLKETKTKEKDAKAKKKKKEREAVQDPKVKELLEKYKDDPLFSEFMETRLGKKSFWSNDVLGGTGDGPAANETTVEELKSRILDSIPDKELASAKISDLEYLQRKIVKSSKKTIESNQREDSKKSSVRKDDSESISEEVDSKKGKKKEFFYVKLSNLPYNINKRDLKQFMKPLKPKSIRIPRHVKSFAFVGFLTEKEAKQAAVRNRSFIRDKRVFVVLYKERENSKADDKDDRNDKTEKFLKQEESLKTVETISESGRIFVRNLPYCATEEDIIGLFSKYGEVSEVTLPVDPNTRKSKGFAIVTFLLPEDAIHAFNALDGTTFQGRMLHLLPAKTKLTPDELLEQEGLDFQKRKSLLHKKLSTSSHNWNTLFLGQNAVTDLIADAYNTTKEKVLDDSGKGSVAVRLALGETQIVAETKKFLLENGVQLDAFNRPATNRSKTVILVKNLPAKTTSLEIRALFEPYGLLGRVILPPTGVTCLVEFMDSSEAKRAFLKLAYSKFKNLPLYLEWAPVDALIETSSDSSENSSATAKDAAAKDGSSRIPESLIDENDHSVQPEPNTTLFLKNLNFVTTEDNVKEHFKKCGPIAKVTIASKPDPKDPRKRLSQGYGFIQFLLEKSADDALKSLQYSTLDGHKIEIKRSHRVLKSEVMTRKIVNQAKPTGTKILVRNIPFQATENEVFELFKVFGQVKTVRLPKKMVGTGPHRGFAFVDFHSKSDAKNAMEAMCQSTHLYGRRLVLEWAASDDDDVDMIRKRTAERFAGQEPLNKVFRKGVFDMTKEKSEKEEESD